MPRPTSEASQAWASKPLKRKRRKPTVQRTLCEALTGKTEEQLDEIQRNLKAEFLASQARKAPPS